MKVAIRVDASNQIGTGHVMRCLTLAEELLAKEARVVFVCREHPGHLCELVEEKGYDLVRLSASAEDAFSLQDEEANLAHTSWLGAAQAADAEQTVQALKDNAPWDWLIVDHYALDHRWESPVRKVANKIIAIDDLADRKHDCDILLDQNYFREPEKRYKDLLPHHCETLLGPRYALLRPEFRKARKFCRMRGNGIARVLVYFGGNDPGNLTGMALEALSDKKLCHLLVEAVIGPNNPHRTKLEKQVQQRPGTRLHVQPDGFTELMLRADLCIGAGGTTTWERLCLGLPSLVITVAENQEPLTAELHNNGFISWVGRNHDISVANIKSCLQAMLEKPQSDGLVSDAPLPVDGLGALRIAERIVPSARDELSLRQACLEDMEPFYFWANDPVVRENSFQQEPIAWHEHATWFKNKLDSPDSCLWVLQTPRGLPVGQIRFDIQDGLADIDYSLDPLVRGRGWGEFLLKKGLTEFKRIHRDTPCQGRVKVENNPSRLCFQRLGFIEKSYGGGSVFHWR